MRDMANTYRSLSASTMAILLRRGAVTSVELTKQALDLVDRYNRNLGIFVSVWAEDALANAEWADAELASGHDLGPLHGIPYSAKDLIDVKGRPTTCGSASSFGTERAEHDAAVISKMRHAGAILIGKTKLHEFAYGATSDRSAQGPSLNPRDPERISGGSSGGSAVSVASGIVPVSIGTDTGGSVRIPAALCGISGFKPAFGAVSTSGVYPLAPSFDHVGILSRAVDDLRTTYEVLAGKSAELHEHVSEPVHIAWVDTKDIAIMDPRIVAVCRSALRIPGIDLVSSYEVADICTRLSPSAIFTSIQRRQALSSHIHHLERDINLIDPDVAARLSDGRLVTDQEYRTAELLKSTFTEEITSVLAKYDVLAMPTVPVTAPPLGASTVNIAGEMIDTRIALISVTSIWNLSGVPAISIPVGDIAGLPVGLQLVALPGHEAKLFDTAERILAATAVSG